MISVIIINYKQKKFTESCVASVYDNIKSTSFEVIVINNSPEDDLSGLEKTYEELKVVSNVNKGFSQANNLGAKHSKGDYLFFLNADTVIRSDFTKEFLSMFGSKEFGAVGLKLYNEDGTFQLSTGKEINFFNEIKNKEDEQRFRERDNEFIGSKEKEFDKVTEADWVTGAAMIIRKVVYEKAGGFDESYFLYYEDADICKRLQKEGLKNYFYPDSDIVHLKGENENPEFRTDTYYYSKESQLNYYKKHNGVIDNVLLRSYLLIKFTLKYIFSFNKLYLKIVKAVLGMKAERT
ncbi:MAG: glycosyltransferase family 2 protein [Ignavibacteria bacterium]|nr:glycosyltransferase family 2 protein [Ignavibacteria bacterium]